MNSDQLQFVSIVELERVIKSAKENNRPIEIDWVNRTINVLTPETVTVINGKLFLCQDYIDSVNFFN